MRDVYHFVSGPLAWAAWTVFFLGSFYRLVSMYQLAKDKDTASLAYMDAKYSLRSILHWLTPYGSIGWRTRPALTAATFIFHVCLLLVAIFVSAHATIWDYAFGIDVPSLPADMADGMTLAVVGACVFFALRRLLMIEVRYVTRTADWVALCLAGLPFVTGFLAYHQVFDYRTMAVLHVLAGEAFLVSIPFTRLSHALFAPFTRAYMGSEFGAVRHAKDW
jgi:nitrate reductase gamma subunit